MRFKHKLLHLDQTIHIKTFTVCRTSVHGYVSDETLTGLCSGNREALCPHVLFMSSCKIKTEAGSHRDAVDRPSVGLLTDAQLSDTVNTGKGCSYHQPNRMPPAVWWPRKAIY